MEKRPRREQNDRTPRRGSGPSRASGSGAGRPDRRSDSRKDDHGDWRDRRDPVPERTVSQEEYDGPDLPEEITGRELDRSVHDQLKGLPEKLAARVARHIAAAGMVMETEPETAYKHTLAARARASRIAVVREACGEAAYAAGHFQVALSELRAARRMNGAHDYLPVIADCERALGRPQKALEIARQPAIATLPADQRMEMTIVEAGARRDMGQVDAALRVLESAPLHSQSRESWVARLRYAYAETLLVNGQREKALEWFHRTEGVDGEQQTDAAARVRELEASSE